MRINVAACDKCGKYFLPNEKGSINPGFVIQYGRAYDLCKDCLKRFDNWMASFIKSGE
jgi:hypothetical protein